MAKETGQESKGPGQDDPLYKAWLSNSLEFLSRVFGHRLADVLVAFAIMLLVFLAVSFVYGLIWYLSPIFSANDKLSTADRKDLVQGFASVAQAAAVGLTGVAGFIGLAFTWRNIRQTRESTQDQLQQAQEAQQQTYESTKRTLELTEQGQITERFTRAIEQLGATNDKGEKKLEIRLGGIYALERIDKDSPERAYHGTVMEVLTAYVRENSHWKPEGTPPPMSAAKAAQLDAEERRQDVGRALRRLPADIRAILDVLKRREEEHVPEEHRVRLDLRGANLQEADLYGANLQRADLQGADFRGANLGGVEFQYANLQEANLQEANLSYAKLQHAELQHAKLQHAYLFSADLYAADLAGAELQGASLLHANLHVASLRGADLQGVNFKRVNLEYAYLTGANLGGAKNLTIEQIKWVVGDEETKLPEYLVEHRPGMWNMAPTAQQLIIEEHLDEVRG